MYNSNFNNQNILSNILVWGLILGTYVSNIPQFYRLYKRKNVLGISEKMIIFGICSCLLSVSGAFMKNKTNFNEKCNVYSYDCYLLTLGILQLSGPYICAHILYILYYYYCKNQVLILLNQNIPKVEKVKKRFYSILLFTIVIIIYTFSMFLFASQNVNNINNEIFNILSCIFSIIMWMPQIYETYKIKGNYSLSVFALFIHCIGCILTIYFQVEYNNQGIFVIIPYIIGALFEFIVIIQCIYYKLKEKNTQHSLYENLVVN